MRPKAPLQAVKFTTASDGGSVTWNGFYSAARSPDYRRGEPKPVGSFPIAASFLGWEDSAGIGRGLHHLAFSGSGSIHSANSLLPFRIKRLKWLRAAKIPKGNNLELIWKNNDLVFWA